jgi:hypothetical protein
MRAISDQGRPGSVSQGHEIGLDVRANLGLEPVRGPLTSTGTAMG